MCKNYPFFADLPADLQRAVAPRVVRQPLYRKQVLYRQGEQATHVHWLESGRVLLYRRIADGRKRWRGVLGAGRLVGEQALVGESWRAEEAVVEEPGTACSISVEDWQTLARRWPVLREVLVRYLARQLRERLQEIEWMTFAEPHERLAAYLHRLAQQEGEKVAITHELLAAFARSSRETTTRTLTRLSKRGVIAKGRQHLQVVQPEYLEKLALGLEEA